MKGSMKAKGIKNVKSKIRKGKVQRNVGLGCKRKTLKRKRLEIDKERKGSIREAVKATTYRGRMKGKKENERHMCEKRSNIH